MHLVYSSLTLELILICINFEKLGIIRHKRLLSSTPFLSTLSRSLGSFTENRIGSELLTRHRAGFSRSLAGALHLTPLQLGTRLMG